MLKNVLGTYTYRRFRGNASCLIAAARKRSWWYSINDPDDESSIASALYLEYADYTNSLLNLGLLKISRREGL